MATHMCSMWIGRAMPRASPPQDIAECARWAPMNYSLFSYWRTLRCWMSKNIHHLQQAMRHVSLRRDGEMGEIVAAHAVLCSNFSVAYWLKCVVFILFLLYPVGSDALMPSILIGSARMNADGSAHTCYVFVLDVIFSIQHIFIVLYYMYIWRSTSILALNSAMDSHPFLFLRWFDKNKNS